jgi:hypothetical protein
MKYLLALLAFAVAALAAEPVVTVDLYGNVFVDGQNTNRQIGDFARDPANFAFAPQIDAAVRDAALAGRTRIAAEIQSAQAAAAAQVATKEAEKAAAITAAEQARDAAIAAHTEAKAAEIAAKDAQIATLTARVAELEDQLAAANTPAEPAQENP